MADADLSVAELQAEIDRLTQYEQEITGRGLADDRLRLHALMDNLPDRIYFKDRESKFVQVNRALAQQYGLDDPEQAIGKSDSDFFAPEHAARTRSDEEAVMSTGEPLVALAKEELWPDGRRTWVTTAKLPWRDVEGNIIGTFGLSRDITELKQTEDALKNSKILYESLVENLTQNVFVKDREGKFKFANQQFCETVGHSLDDLIGKTDYDLFSKQLADKYRADDERIMETGETYDEVEEVRSASGESIFVQTLKSPLRNADGEVVGVQGMFWDVTEEKRIEEARFRLAIIVESSRDAIVTTDLEGKVLTWNPGAQQMYGYTAEEMIGQKVNRLRPERDREQVAEVLSRLAAGEEIKHYEAVHQTKDGREIDVLLTVSPLREAGGQIVGTSCIASDITESKQNRRVMHELAAIVESSTDPIIGQTLQGQIINWNRAAANLYGYQAEEVLDKPFSVLLPDDHQEDFYSMIGHIARSESLVQHRTTHRTKAGDRIDVMVTAFPTVDKESERVIGISVLIHAVGEA